MPYSITKIKNPPKGAKGPFQVKNAKTGVVKGHSETKAKAEKYVTMLERFEKPKASGGKTAPDKSSKKSSSKK